MGGRDRAQGHHSRGLVGHLDFIVLVAASCVAVWRYMWLHAILAPSAAPPLALFEAQHRVPPAGFGWWSWWDQSAYVQAALAWADGRLEPAYHWFLPGYALLGAPFAHRTSAEPFMWPDLACLLGALWLFAGLTARLAGDMGHARAIGAVVFAATTVGPQQALWSWVVPWTTTPEAVCLLACLLAAARFVQRPRALDAFFAAACGVATAGFRPADAAVVVLVSGAVMAWGLLRPWLGWPRVLRIAAAALAGAALSTAIFGGAYAATNGLAASEYVKLSRAIGFEWRLLPQRWVTLMIDPKPLFAEGRGLAAAFPWIAPGIAGMAACLVAPLGVPRRLHILLIGATLVDCAMFLTYRDLHPTGLWSMGNFHYFKWTLPVFGLYAALLLRVVARMAWLATAASAVAILALFMWRAELTDGMALPPVSSAQRLTLPAGLSRMDDVVLAKGAGDAASLYGGGSYLRAGASTFQSYYDFKVFAWSDSFMVLPLRALPATPSTLDLAPVAVLDAAVAPILAHQTLVWGLPCWVMRDRAGCRPRFLLPARSLPLDESLAFGNAGADAGYLVSGWSIAEQGGRWTDGSRATMRFAVPPAARAAPLTFEITANGFVPTHDDRLRVTLNADGHRIVDWSFGPGAPEFAQAAIPLEALAPDGAVTLDLIIADPHQPLPDIRELGLFVRSVRLRATAHE